MSQNKITLKVPNIGETDDIEIVSWHKNENESFEKEEELCDLVTDKAAFSLEAPGKGLLIKQLVPKGAKVKVGDPLAQIELI